MAKALGHWRPPEPPDQTVLFARIADALTRDGHIVLADVLDPALLDALVTRVQTLRTEAFTPAGIGRANDQMHNAFVRRDEIRWLERADAAESAWLTWVDELREYLNRRLFLGLFSYEGHFAHYPPGAFYKRHLDAFRGQANRVLTTVLYLNPTWQPEDGGQMVLYPEVGEAALAHIEPILGTLAIFLSEEFPHEVLPARRDRYSIAGWYRVNASTTDRADPPR